MEDIDLNNEHDIIYLKSEIMKKSIYELKEPYRTVIIMRELQKMQYKDIAEKLDINLSTIKSRIKAGRRILIENTKKEFEQIDYLYT
jgi:RNA polymerase sigma-70 factor (ECF subfamily)